MGWLFGRKRKPKVPLPEGHPIDERELLFPKSPKKGVEPEEIKEAVGVEEPFPPKEEEDQPIEEELPSPQGPEFPTEEGVDSLFEQEEGPLFIKADVYKGILGELENLKLDSDQLKNISKNLGKSEFNEEKSFSKLKRVIKSIHDSSVMLDKILFKGE